jgi:ferredoxin-type protein NapG
MPRDLRTSRRKFLRYVLEGVGAAALVALTGRMPARAGYIRPPGAADEKELYRKCIKCGACIEVCPTRALDQLDLTLDVKNLGTPILNPRYGGCIAWKHECLRCIEVCPTDALVRFPDLRVVKIGLAGLEREKCVNCMLCMQKCPVEGAILFPNPEGLPFKNDTEIPSQLKIFNSPLKPYVDDSRCVGCGLCVHYCPVKVMYLVPPADRSAT